ncbi:MAG: hypothetical protein M3083_09670 [Actinomycetota bacterium]|nr:hypothetical protein [Actinomycetota bacterium]
MHQGVVREQAKLALLEAERQYQRARIDDYLTRLIRDRAMVEAHRAGLSSREISDLLGGIGQPNVVRARRRAAGHAGGLADGLLSPADALRASGLAPGDFIDAVRQGRIEPVRPRPGIHVFRADDVRDLAEATSER